MKTCNKCGAMKTLESFRKNKASKDGYDWYCKNCKSDYETERRGASTRLNRRNHDVEPKPLSLEDLIREAMTS